MTVRRAFARLHALFRKERLERELDDQIDANLELAEHDALSRGLSAEAARQEARPHFGASSGYWQAFSRRTERSISILRWLCATSVDCC